MKRLLILFSVLALIAVGVSVAIASAQATLVTVTARTKVHSQPSADSAYLRDLLPGQVVYAQDMGNDWYKLVDGSGYFWAHYAVTLTPSPVVYDSNGNAMSAQGLPGSSNATTGACSYNPGPNDVPCPAIPDLQPSTRIANPTSGPDIPTNTPPPVVFVSKTPLPTRTPKPTNPPAPATPCFINLPGQGQVPCPAVPS